MKIIFIVLIVIYVLSIGLFMNKYEISYRVMGVNPNLVEERNLTNDEMKNILKAETFRIHFGTVMLIFSLLTMVASTIVLYFKLFDKVFLIKLLLIISIIMFLLLALAKSIHFGGGGIR